jgi:serine phosphatase RsbU (regulator of sigma subunit)/predicted ester cyclase
MLMGSTHSQKISVGVEKKRSVSAEENKALVRRFIEAQAKGDIEALDELLAPGFVDHNLLPGQEPGREGFIRGVAQDHAASSLIDNAIEYQVIDGIDTVISRYTTRVRHDRGEFFGLTPTGKVTETMSIVIHRIEGSKIAEEWGATDAGPLLEDIEQQARERERIEQDLRVARRIQQASLPEGVPTIEGWQIDAYYRPAREVGGDFYHFHLLPGDRLGLVVGDATGKGVPAALMMSTACGMLQVAAQALGSTSPGEILSRVNEALLTRIPPNMFVTCFYSILDPETGHMSYANAGHDLPYVRRNGDTEELRASGMPLGLMPGMCYEEKEIKLRFDEAALFYSDGLVEAHDPRGEMFGFPRLRELVVKHGREGSLGDFLMEELYSFVGEGWEQEDDITILTLRRC